MENFSQNEFKANSWIDLQEFIFNEKDQNIDRFRSNYVYRGIPNKEWELLTSIQRIGTIPSNMEKHLMRNFKRYSANEILSANYNIWDWIALAQHHGLPTRLLDWTFSPNVALHFMTEDISTFDKDGALWLVDFNLSKNFLPNILQKELGEEGSFTFTSDQLNKIIGATITNINKFKEQESDALVFFEPLSINSRIINQYALFSFMTNPDTNIESWLSSHPSLYKKIIVPSSLKWEIRDKLDQANITERIIYPGLDGISKWLKRWYSEKEEKKRWNC